MGELTRQKAAVAVDASVRRFWDNYIILLEKNGVKSGQHRWYVRRAEASISRYANEKLATHGAAHVSQSLQELGRQNRLKDWHCSRPSVLYGHCFVILCNQIGEYWGQSHCCPVRPLSSEV